MAVMVYPQLYSKASNFFISNTAYILNKYKHLIQWKKSPSILEIGFGEGSNSKHNLLPLIPKDYEEFVAIDLSEKMLNFAKKNVVIPKSKFYQMDVNIIPTEFNSRFDHIFSFFVLHLLKNPKNGFSNIKKMLKPGGEIFCLFFVQTPLDSVFDMLLKHPKWKIYPHDIMLPPFYLEKNPRACLKQAIEDGGFKDFYLELEELTYKFDNVQAAYDLFFAVNAVMQYIPDRELDEYKKCFIDDVNTNVLIFDEQQKNEDGSLRPEVKFKLCVVHARNT